MGNKYPSINYSKKMNKNNRFRSQYTEKLMDGLGHK